MPNRLAILSFLPRRLAYGPFTREGHSVVCHRNLVPLDRHLLQFARIIAFVYKYRIISRIVRTYNSEKLNILHELSTSNSYRCSSTMANDAALDNGFGTVPMQQTNTQTPPDYLDHTHREETTKFNVFHVKLQFRADPPTENNQKPITTKLFHLVSHIVSHHSHVVLKTASGQELDLKTPFATDAIAKTATQLTQNESARGRNITMIMTIETTHRQLNKIKYPMLAWLQKENYWFERHLFKTTQIDICHLGFIVGKCPTDTHHATFQQMINDKIAALMMGQATDVYYREKIYNYDGAPRDIPSVRVLFQKPAWPMRGPPVVRTKALGIDCLREERAALLDLLPQVFPSDGLAVFVPSSLPHDNTIPDATDKFMDMLHAQNVYLANHRSIQLAGISEEDMHRLTLNATIGTIASHIYKRNYVIVT